AADCGLLIVVQLLFNGWAKLQDIGRNWNTLSYMSIQIEKIMSDLDENKDGEVDFQEFVILVAALTSTLLQRASGHQK
uniref:EF-hand domain-containing protein n=1 Tax=Salmo trutta TaxID=8032 RepID=A0A673X4Z7_SALTR